MNERGLEAYSPPGTGGGDSQWPGTQTYCTPSQLHAPGTRTIPGAGGPETISGSGAGGGPCNGRSEALPTQEHSSGSRNANDSTKAVAVGLPAKVDAEQRAITKAP